MDKVIYAFGSCFLIGFSLYHFVSGNSNTAGFSVIFGCVWFLYWAARVNDLLPKAQAPYNPVLTVQNQKVHGSGRFARPDEMDEAFGRGRFSDSIDDMDLPD